MTSHISPSKKDNHGHKGLGRGYVGIQEGNSLWGET